MSKSISILCAAVALAAVSGAARADFKVVQTVQIESPQFQAAMQSMSPEQKAELSKMGVSGSITSTVYVKGQMSRTDIGAINSTIVDENARKITSLNRTSRTYSTSPLSVVYGGKQMNGVHASVKGTGKTKLILGHLCRDYKLSMTTPSLPGGTISGDIWAAADLPHVPVPALSGPAAALGSQWSKISGMPLQMTIVVTGSAAGTTTVKSIARSISGAPLAPSVFTVPAGYQPGPAYGPMMGGGPMGG